MKCVRYPDKTPVQVVHGVMVQLDVNGPWCDGSKRVVWCGVLVMVSGDRQSYDDDAPLDSTLLIGGIVDWQYTHMECTIQTLFLEFPEARHMSPYVGPSHN